MPAELKHTSYQTDDHGGFIRDPAKCINHYLKPELKVEVKVNGKWVKADIYDRSQVSISAGYGLKIGKDIVIVGTECRFKGGK